MATITQTIEIADPAPIKSSEVKVFPQEGNSPAFTTQTHEVAEVRVDSFHSHVTATLHGVVETKARIIGSGVIAVDLSSGRTEDGVRSSLVGFLKDREALVALRDQINAALGEDA